MLEVWNISMDTLLIQLLLMVLYIIGADLVFGLQLSVGSVFAFITYSTYVTSPISGILNIGYMLSGIIPSTKRYYEFMDLLEEDEGRALVSPEFGTMQLKDISFSYMDNKPIFDHVNITFEKGSKTALIGKNGSGKSTIIGLITRMYEPTEGEILQAVKDSGLEDFIEEVSFDYRVGQNGALLSKTKDCNGTCAAV